MNGQDLREALLELLRDVRRLGRGASRAALAEALDLRLPDLLVAADAYGMEHVGAQSREKMLGEVLATVRARVELGRADEGARGERASSKGLLAWPWAIGVAGALAAATLGYLWLGAPKEETLVVIDRPSEIAKPSPDKPAAPREPVVRRDPDVSIRRTPPLRSSQPEVVAVPQPKIGVFGEVSGQPLVWEPGRRQPVVATPNRVVSLGSRIQTGDADRLELKFDDGTLLRLGFNTSLSIPGSAGGSSRAARPERVVLEAGRLYAKVTRRPEEARFRVETRAATAEVIGTEFGVKVESLSAGPGAKQKATLQVKEGKVSFFNSHGRQIATERTESWATEATAPTEPKRREVLGALELTDGHKFIVSTSKLDPVEASKRFATLIGFHGLIAVTVEPSKVKVIWSQRDRAAYRAGVRAGDRIVALNGHTIRTFAQYNALAAMRPSADVTLTVQRQDETFDVLIAGDVYRPLDRPATAPLQAMLDKAAFQAIQGNPEVAKAEFSELVQRTRHPAAYNGLGVAHEMLDDMGAAIRAYGTAVSLESRSALYRLNLGLALRQVGNFDRAIEELQAAVNLDPSWSKSIVALTGTLELAKRLEDSRAQLTRSLERFPGNLHLLFALGRAQLALQDLVGAKATVARLFELEPDWVYGLGLAAEIHHDERNLEATESAFRRLVEIDPTSKNGWTGLARVLSEARRLSELAAVLETVVKLDPADYGWLNALGVTYQSLGRNSEAERVLEKVIGMKPGDWIPLYNLARLKHDSEDLTESVRLYRQALALAPREPQVWNGLGLVAIRTGDLKEAETCWRKAVEFGPTHVLAHTNLAVVLLETDHIEEAIGFATKATKLAPGLERAWSVLGHCLLGAGRFQESESVLRKAYSLNPNDMLTVQGLLLALIKQDARTDELLDLARKVETLDPENLETLLAAGWAYGLAGSYEKAESLLTRSLAETEAASDPENAPVWYVFGSVLEALGKTDKAIEAYRRSVQLSPNSPKAAEALKRLGG